MHRLDDLADVVSDAGLAVIESAGWRTRGRTGDGGYWHDDRPDHLIVHHTASTTTAANDVAYMTTAEYYPIGNLYLARDGTVWIVAAGPSNHAGKGRDTWQGGVADDDMNRHAIGIEAGNAGTGEPWPAVQSAAYIRLCAALCRRYGIGPAHVRAHHEWAPDRKIDPAGPSPWGPGSWQMDAFRTDLAFRLEEDSDVDPTPARTVIEKLARILPPAASAGIPPEGAMDDAWRNWCVVTGCPMPDSADRAAVENAARHPGGGAVSEAWHLIGCG